MDINNRLNLIIASTRMPNTAESRKKLLPQITETLIIEQIQMQEAKIKESKLVTVTLMQSSKI